MTKKATNGNEDDFGRRLLARLLEDPTRSVRAIATDLGSYRQRVWRHKRALERDRAVWGYTAVLDESRLGSVMYVVLMKMRPMDAPLADLIIKRQASSEFHRQEVRLINVLYVNGEYDWVVMFTARDHATARRYYDSLRVAYEDYLIDKPHIIDVNFALVREGKVNPGLGGLRDYVPK